MNGRRLRNDGWSLGIQVFAGLIVTALVTGGAALIGAASRALDIVLAGLIAVLLVVVVALVAALRATRREMVRLTHAAEAAEKSNRRLDEDIGELTESLQALEHWQELEVTGLKGVRKALSGSEMHPKEALETIETSLDFMGHGASKWSDQTDKMHKMLLRVRDNGGAVRMLVLDPRCNDCVESSRTRFPDDPAFLPRKITKSLLKLERLAKVHPNLTIRLYTHQPIFRITIIDRREVVVGHYRSYQSGSEASPLLLIGARAEWSFFTPFQMLFRFEWDAADDVEWQELHTYAQMLDLLQRHDDDADAA
jgi:hypothetical protein